MVKSKLVRIYEEDKKILEERYKIPIAQAIRILVRGSSEEFKEGLKEAVETYVEARVMPRIDKLEESIQERLNHI